MPSSTVVLTRTNVTVVTPVEEVFFTHIALYASSLQPVDLPLYAPSRFLP